MKVLPSILAYLVFVLLLAIPPIILQHTGYAEFLAPKFWLLFFYISGLTFLVVGAIIFVQVKNADYYAQAFLAGTTVKILACMIFMVVFLMKIKVGKNAFMGDFIYIYFLNMAFEVYLLLRNLRHKNLR